MPIRSSRPSPPSPPGQRPRRVHAHRGPRRAGRRVVQGLCAALFAAPGLLAPVAEAAEPLPTVVSTNLCADLLLLAVGAPEQIRSLSRQAQDARFSPVAEAARAYPANAGTVEDLLYLRPDIALVYAGWNRRRHADLLAGRGTRVIELPYPKGWADALATTRQVADQIGRGAVGATLAEAADRRLTALADGTRPWRLLYLRPSGGTAGAGTFVDDLITRLGMRNLAAEQGRSGWGRFPLEDLVRAPPDAFLLGYFDQQRTAVGSAYGRHPVLRGLLARVPTLAVPARAWGCGGLELLDAAAAIRAGVDRLEDELRMKERNNARE